MKKRILAMLMAVICVVGSISIPQGVLASEEQTSTTQTDESATTHTITETFDGSKINQTNYISWKMRSANGIVASTRVLAFETEENDGVTNTYMKAAKRTWDQCESFLEIAMTDGDNKLLSVEGKVKVDTDAIKTPGLFGLMYEYVAGEEGAAGAYNGYNCAGTDSNRYYGSTNTVMDDSYGANSSTSKNKYYIWYKGASYTGGTTGTATTRVNSSKQTEVMTIANVWLTYQIQYDYEAKQVTITLTDGTLSYVVNKTWTGEALCYIIPSFTTANVYWDDLKLTYEGGDVHTHEYDGYQTDATGHWQVCTTCQTATDVTAHSDSDTDEDELCDICGYSLHVHQYEMKCDETTHWNECSSCDEKKDVTAHTWSGVFDTICSVCGYEGTIPSYSLNETFDNSKLSQTGLISWKKRTSNGFAASNSTLSFAKDDSTSDNYLVAPIRTWYENTSFLEIAMTDGENPLLSVEGQVYISTREILDTKEYFGLVYEFVEGTDSTNTYGKLGFAGIYKSKYRTHVHTMKEDYVEYQGDSETPQYVWPDDGTPQTAAATEATSEGEQIWLDFKVQYDYDDKTVTLSLTNTTYGINYSYTVNYTGEPLCYIIPSETASEIHWDNLKLTYAGEPETRFAGVNMAIGDSVDLTYYLKVAQSDATNISGDLTAKFVMDGVSEAGVDDATGTRVEDGDVYDIYAFTFTDIRAQEINKKITATVSVNGTEITHDYTVMKYCNNFIGDMGYVDAGYASVDVKNTADTLIVDLVNFCTEVQKYRATVENVTLSDSDWFIKALGSGGLTGSTHSKSITNPNVTVMGQVDDVEQLWTSLTLVSKDKVSIRSKFSVQDVEDDNLKVNVTKANVTETLTVGCGITKLSDGSYQVDYDNILPTQYGDVISFAVYNGDTQISWTLNYSVNQYIYSMKDNETIGNLAKALYNYGMQATAFKDCFESQDVSE